MAAGYDTVYIHLSSEISGTYQTARMLLSEYEDKLRFHVVDSGSSCMVMELLVKGNLSLVWPRFAGRGSRSSPRMVGLSFGCSSHGRGPQ